MESVRLSSLAPRISAAESALLPLMTNVAQWQQTVEQRGLSTTELIPTTLNEELEIAIAITAYEYVRIVLNAIRTNTQQEIAFTDNTIDPSFMDMLTDEQSENIAARRRQAVIDRAAEAILRCFGGEYIRPSFGAIGNEMHSWRSTHPRATRTEQEQGSNIRKKEMSLPDGTSVICYEYTFPIGKNANGCGPMYIVYSFQSDPDEKVIPQKRLPTVTLVIEPLTNPEDPTNILPGKPF